MPAKFVTCSLCGQGFGSASIAIHVPQCYDKALKRWQLDPRGPKPVLPTRGAVASTIKPGPGSLLPSSSEKPVRVALVQHAQSLYSEPEPSGNVNLHPCRHCRRTFAFDRIAYHESVCNGSKKRKTFNSKKQRLSDFDEFEIKASQRPARGGRSFPQGGRGASGAVALGTGVASTSWRRQHADFIAAIRSAKQYRNEAAKYSALQQPSTAGKQQGAPAPVARRSNTSDTTGSRSNGLFPPATSRGAPPRQMYNSNALRDPQTFSSSAARGLPAGRGGGGQLGLPAQFSKPPAGSGRGAANAARSTGGAWGGGAPSYRIVNSNQTSKAMMEALGRF